MKFNIKERIQKFNRAFFSAWLLAFVFIGVVFLNVFSFWSVKPDNSMQMQRIPVKKNSVDTDNNGSEQDMVTGFVECREFEIRHLLRNYYDVLSSGDRTELSKYVDDVSGISDEFLSQNLEYVEKYMDIQCYYMEGMMPGTYLVVAYSYVKFYGIDTTIPVIDEFYVCSNAHGRYYICENDIGEEIETYNRYMFENSQILEMHKMQQQERENAMEYDPMVEELLKKIGF